MTALRTYQVDIVGEFERTVAAGRKRIILTAPTGSGKTVIAAEIIKHTIEPHQRVLVLSHRHEIITGTSAKLYAHGIRHGIIKAGLENLLRPLEAVQIASVQTLWSRAVRSEAMPLPPADLLIIDEAHHCPANTYSKIIESYPEAILLGLTATPCRGDGRGLGGIFEIIIECPQIAVLIEQGYLVRTRIYAPTNPDLRGVHTVAGDYVESQLADRMDQPKLVGDVVVHWFKYGEHRKTVAFATSVGHSVHIRDEFVRAGVRAEHIDAQTAKDERDAILARLASGETRVVSNCAILTEGFDCPDIGCIVLARPTKKMGLFRQMIGRGLRPADDKSDCVILDHSGAVFRHGLPEDHVEWTLDPDLRAMAPEHQKRQSASESKLLECTQCSALRVGGLPCPACGFLPKRPAQYIAHVEGELVEYRTKPLAYETPDRRRWHAMLRQAAIERGKSPGWAFYLYQQKFHEKPDWAWRNETWPPTDEVYAWVRSRVIAYAKAQQAKARGAA